MRAPQAEINWKKSLHTCDSLMYRLCVSVYVCVCMFWEQGMHVLVPGGEVMASVNKDNMNQGQGVRG